MDSAPRYLDILEVLAQHQVEHIVVGGVAAILEGAPVSTFDLDIVPDPAHAGAEATRRVLTFSGVSRPRPTCRA